MTRQIHQMDSSNGKIQLINYHLKIWQNDEIYAEGSKMDSRKLVRQING